MNIARRIFYNFGCRPHSIDFPIVLESIFKNIPNNFTTASVTSCCYALFCKSDNKFYIGSTKDIKKRISHHSNLLGNRLHPNGGLQEAYDKYGKDDFYFIVLDRCTNKKASLQKCENIWLERMRGHLYNIQNQAYKGNGYQKRHPYYEKGYYDNYTKQQKINELEQALFNETITFPEAVLAANQLGYDIEWIKRN